MSRLANLKEAQSLSDLAKLLGYKANSLSYILYLIPENSKYREFEIPKKNGKQRKITAPKSNRVKVLQRRLADLLNECFEQINRDNNRKSLSHGFRKNHSISTNAQNHKNKRYVFNVDLQDFFPSINFGRVRGFFIKNNDSSLDPKVATIIAQIACHKNELPQGSPCSPIISNLIGHLLDIRMVNLAKKAKCTYSRYADDLTFSTNKKDFPNIIAINKEENHWVAGKKLINEVEKVGFTINPAKTSMQFKTSRQTTTGLIVNEKVNIKREYYKNARSMCHNLFKNDSFHINGKEGTIEQLDGILNFIFNIKKTDDEKKNPSPITVLYRKFIFYRYFFLIDKPLLICEGKTDNIYLKCALKQLAPTYDDFIDIDKNKINYKIKFFKLTKKWQEIFFISGGTPGLELLLNIYEENINKFRRSENNFPVIMILDNDKGAKSIKKKIKLKEEKKDEKYKIYNNIEDISGNEAIYFYTKNLYILIIPKEKGKAIESFFDSTVFSTLINGKKFDPEKAHGDETSYAKYMFADKVVRANQQNINFDKFKEIFDDIRFIIEDYKKRQSDKK